MFKLVFREKLHANGFHTVKYVRLDVTDLTTIQAAKETIDLAEGKLDVLVNNAGTFLLLSAFFIVSSKLIRIVSYWQTGGRPECDFCLSWNHPRHNGNQFFRSRPNYHRFSSSFAQIDKCCHTECRHNEQHNPSTPERRPSLCGV